MDSNQLQQLLGEPEGLKLDFKREMYKLNSDSPEARKRQGDEMIKDILSIANGNVLVPRDIGYLIIGAGDKLKLDRSRDLYDVGVVNLTSQGALEKINAACEPPLPDLQVETIILQNTRLLVFIVPPSLHLHETTRRLETSKSSYNEGTVFIRRSEGIHPALATEREAIKEVKRTAFQLDTVYEMPNEDDSYSIEKSRFDGRAFQLKGINKGRALFSRAELLFFRINKIKTEERDMIKIGRLYIDAKMYLELALKEKNLNADQKARSYCMLAKLYDEFERDPFTAYDFCCKSIQKREDYIEAYRVRIQLGRVLIEGEDNSYREQAEKNLPLDEEKLQALLRRKALLS